MDRNSINNLRNLSQPRFAQKLELASAKLGAPRLHRNSSSHLRNLSEAPLCTGTRARICETWCTPFCTGTRARMSEWILEVKVQKNTERTHNPQACNPSRPPGVAKR